MGRVTIYLDERTETVLKRHVRKSGEPVSRWVAEAVRRRLASEWPPDVLKLFGKWKPDDFPEAAGLRQSYALDGKREVF